MPKSPLFKALGAINNTYRFGCTPDALLTGRPSAHYALGCGGISSRVWVTNVEKKPIARLVFAAALLAAVAVPLSGARAATVVFSDNFNSDPQGLNITPAGWNLTQGTVDVIGAGFYDYYPGNGNYIDLNGSTLQYGGIGTAPPSFGPGHYILTFELGGNVVGPNYGDNGPKTTDIGLGSWSTTISLNANDPLTLYTYSFDTTGGSLAFSMAPDGIANIGNILDDVVLSETPLPSTWTMLIAGFVGFGFLAYRGRKKDSAALAAA